jgi:type I restriction enzyme, S subunit
MDTTTFFDNFDRLAEAPNGVAKLRELILQMAVCGKLVPQDPSDEPARDLLQEIVLERQHLHSSGEISKRNDTSRLAERSERVRSSRGFRAIASDRLPTDERRAVAAAAKNRWYIPPRDAQLDPPRIF